MKEDLEEEAAAEWTAQLLGWLVQGKASGSSFTNNITIHFRRVHTHLDLLHTVYTNKTYIYICLFVCLFICRDRDSIQLQGGEECRGEGSKPDPDPSSLWIQVWGIHPEPAIAASGSLWSL